MESRSYHDPHSMKESAVLDVKPLRSLAPMFPAPLGQKSTFCPPNAPPFVCVTPLGSFATDSAYPPGFCPFFSSIGSPQDLNQIPVEHPSYVDEENGFPRASGGTTPPTFNKEAVIIDSSGKAASRSSNYRTFPADSSASEGSKRKKNKSRRSLADSTLLPSSHDSRESVEVVLSTFDALRRRLMQIDEAKRLRPDLKAGSIMMSNDLRANKEKRIGPVPGVDVGDIFYFRIEMCLVGLHSQSISGIDYKTISFVDQEDPVAVGIVSAGVYGNEEDSEDTLIYTGQGSSNNNDQKLERGNLALEKSLHRANDIRVIRSAKDPSINNGKIYVYDGVYKIHESWVEKGKTGFNTFKYKFLRQPGQPDGIAVWKRIEKWKENPSSRGNMVLSHDLSSGIENKPVCLVNEVDYEKGPSYFTYSTTVGYPRSISSVKPLQSCMCTSACLPGDANCSCLRQNGGFLPYSSNGILVSRKPLVYECPPSCQCSINCRNRVTQVGLHLHFEVFKTRDCGWGLRCWDAIRAGTFICEYTGEIIDGIRSINFDEETDYVFQPMYSDPDFKWNYVPELLEETSSVDLSETPKLLSFVINSKNKGNIARFMNHSCSPNVFWQPVLHDHGDDRYPHIMFFAIKHIPPMTELTFDYGRRPAEMGNHMNPQREKKCLCGSVKCRGFFI
ncbi:histone-lysine N-methyltransferase, H3 lysine-9 specific SUVH1-like [Curcuma longa]|uniref:histone-lysine N-methyltransferase, H3 lysine-9 specific SUVH1-like n=1 Tax=Curcuma longa TaxID=136217 RepID=UPI003D9F9F65